MNNTDYANDITPAVGGPPLAPDRPTVRARTGHVNRVDWSACPLALRYRVSGETGGGPRLVRGRTEWAPIRIKAA